MTAPGSPFDLVRITAVRHVRDHVLWLEFSDGLAGEVDLAGRLAGPVFEALREASEFARVTLGDETVEWPNGADWAPESLHALVRARHSSGTSSDGAVSAAIATHSRDVPEISRFYGIIVTMPYADQARPHFHGLWRRLDCRGDRWRRHSRELSAQLTATPVRVAER